MKLYIDEKKILFFIIIFNFGIFLKAMESELAQDTRSTRGYEERKIAAPAAASPRLSLSPVNPDFQHGMFLIKSTVGDETDDHILKSKISLLPGPDQKEMIRTAQHYNFDWVLNIACAAYADTLARDNVLHAIMSRSDLAQDAVSIDKRPEMLIVKYFNRAYKDVLVKILFSSHRTPHRIYTLSPRSEDRREAFIVPAWAAGDLVSIERDFLHPEGVAQLVIKSECCKKPTVIDQEQLLGTMGMTLCQVQQSQSHTYFNGRTYQLSPDGSFLLAFSGSQENIDMLIFLERRTDNAFENKIAICLSRPVLTNIYSIFKPQEIKGFPVGTILYDIDTTFAIRPLTKMATYIDTSHKIHMVNFNTGKILPVETEGDAMALGWSPDGIYLAYSTVDAHLRVRGFDSSFFKKDYEFSNQIHKIQWSPDGSKLLLMTRKEVILLNIVDGQILAMFHNENPIVQAVLSDDATKIMMATREGTVSFWDVQSKSCYQTRTFDRAQIISLQLSPDANYASITCEHNGNVSMYVWNIEKKICIEFNTINESTLPMLHKKLLSGMPNLASLSLPKMLLALAAASSFKKNVYVLAKNHYLYAYLTTLTLPLKKVIESKISII